MITITPAAVSAILTVAGWESIVQGSLTIDTIELVPSPASAPESEDYGFQAIGSDGAQIKGRMSALLATKQTSR